MKFSKFDNSGFTLIEILAVVAVIGILAVASATMMRQSIFFDEDGLTRSSLDALMSNAKLARTYATTGHICCGQTLAPNGYGIHVDMDSVGTKNTYYLYAEFDGDYQYTTGTDDEILATGILEEGVEFTTCWADGGTITVAPGEYCDMLVSTGPGLSNLYIGTSTYPSEVYSGEFGIVMQHVDDPTTTATMITYGQTLLIEQD